MGESTSTRPSIHSPAVTGSLHLDGNPVWSTGRILAHRGSRVRWPENTMVAFGGALDDGADHLETDLRLTGDRSLVCFHDATLDRTTDGTGPLTAYGLTELRRFDAGHGHRVGTSFPFRGRGLRIPTMGEVLATFPEKGVVVDLKEDGLQQPLADLLDRMDAWDRVIIGSFYDSRLEEMARLSKGRALISAGRSTVRGWWATSRFRRPWKGGMVALQVPPSFYGLPVVDTRFVDTAHDYGLAVHVWTINQPWEMRRLREVGVDAIITDHPSRAAEAGWA